MKQLPKILLISYACVLAWLVLFKLSVNIPEVMAVHENGVNIVPFAGAQDHLREVFDNFIVFAPLGLLLSVTYKRMSVWRKLAVVFIFSVVAETLQFLLAIGVADITDIISNTAGGLCGLLLYEFIARFTGSKSRDKYIVIVGIVLLAMLLFLRFLVLRVKY